MLFSSVSFLYLFLPVVLFFYFASPKKLKNTVLLLSSLAFYFMGEPIYILLLLISSVSDYIHSLIIDKYRGQKGAKIALFSSVLINLSMLGFFKYADFLIECVNAVFKTDIPLLYIPLPIGISFFTFQTMSYSIDVYRGDVKPEKNLLTFGAYVSLFPQLIAGPIVRYSEVSKELSARRHTLSNISHGIRRFSIGLGKKVLIANVLGEFPALFYKSTQPSTLFFWLSAAFYTLQVYFDFSGYSDMAIGLGKMLGFSFPENFNYPFISKSLSEFWRRWHMTLGTWFRDYVYIPLGGNRVGKIKLLRNLFVVWFLTGLWHGASVNYVCWGLIFAILLSIEKLALSKILEKLPAFLRHVYTIFFILFTFTVFGGEDLTQLFYSLNGMFSGNYPAISPETIYYLKSYGAIFAVAIIGATPLFKTICGKLPKKLLEISEPIFVALLLIFSTACLVNGSFNPFLYFRF